MNWIEVPNKTKHDINRFVVTLQQKEICVLKIQETIFAFSIRCPHMGTSLHDGKLNAFGEIICPLHEYRFQLATGRESGQRCADLETFPVQLRGEKIFIRI